MPSYSNQIDAVGVDLGHRYKSGASIDITLKFLDTNRRVIDVSGRTYTGGIYNVTASTTQDMFVVDSSDAVNGIINLLVEDTSSYTDENDYKVEVWETIGTKKNYIYGGSLVVEDSLLAP